MVVPGTVVSVTLINTEPLVMGGAKLPRTSLVTGQPVSSVNDPVEPTPWTWY
ncbi:hypothetical protein ES703_98311 [subsurface metagenome]